MVSQENTERKDIERLSGNGAITVKGYFENSTIYGATFLLFTTDNHVYSISGFAARQFETVANDLKGAIFKLPYESKHSEQWNKDYIVLGDPKVLSRQSDQTKLKIEFADGEQ